MRDITSGLEPFDPADNAADHDPEFQDDDRDDTRLEADAPQLDLPAEDGRSDG